MIDRRRGALDLRICKNREAARNIVRVPEKSAGSSRVQRVEARARGTHQGLGAGLSPPAPESLRITACIASLATQGLTPSLHSSHKVSPGCPVLAPTPPIAWGCSAPRTFNVTTRTVPGKQDSGSPQLRPLLTLAALLSQRF